MSPSVLRLAHALSLPLDAVTQKLAFLGRTGSGKTYGATKLAEQMLDAGAQVVALDPVGVWYGLRLSADGKSPGIAIPVFGGLHGDVPLESTAGKMVADLIVDRGISVVLDVSQFESDAAKARFARDFAERFFFRKKASPSAVHLFLEECQEFVPQNPAADEKQMLHAFTRLYKLGRNFGIGGSLISQRPQEVNKKALNMTECLLAFQMTGPHERKTVESWVAEKGLDLDIVATLPKLQVGHCHIWSPAWLNVSREIAIERKRTFNASSTPEVGKRAQARELAPIDLEQLRVAMAATIERAKAEDPKLLRARVAELEREARKPAAEAKVEVRTVEKSILLAADRDALGALMDAVERSNDAFDRLRVAIEQRVTLPELRHPNPLPRPTEVRRPAPANASEGGAPRGGRGGRSPASENGNGEVGKGGLRRILIALAQRPRGLNHRQLGLRAGLSSRSGTFATYLGRARSNGWAEGQGELKITAAGIAALGHYDPLPEGRDLLDYWLGEMGEGGIGRMLRALADAYPNALSHDRLGELASVSPRSGTFATYLGRLRGLELVEGRGELRASEELFA